MEDKKIVEVIEDFEMVRPGKVYPETIKEGELVTGREAEIALALEKGLERDPNGSSSQDETPQQETSQTGQVEGVKPEDQATLLDDQSGAGTSVPESKAGPKGEVKSDTSGAKAEGGSTK